MHDREAELGPEREAFAPDEGGRISVVIVEDHPQFREALTEAIEASRDLHLLQVCRDLPAGLEFVEHTRPDVLLVDLGLPSGSGMVLLKSAPIWWGAKCTTAVLTMTGDEEHLLRSATAGAKGCLFKSDLPEEWVRAIRALGSSQGTMHSKMAQHLLQPENIQGDKGRNWDRGSRDVLLHIAAGYTVSETANRMDCSEQEVGTRLRGIYDRLFQPGPNLSRRELQLLRLLNKGLTFKQCADVMGVGESTTKTQSSRAYEKLGASNLQMALYAAREAGLLY